MREKKKIEAQQFSGFSFLPLYSNQSQNDMQVENNPMQKRKRDEKDDVVEFEEIMNKKYKRSF